MTCGRLDQASRFVDNVAPGEKIMELQEQQTLVRMETRKRVLATATIQMGRPPPPPTTAAIKLHQRSCLKMLSGNTIDPATTPQVVVVRVVEWNVVNSIVPSARPKDVENTSSSRTFQPISPLSSVPSVRKSRAVIVSDCIQFRRERRRGMVRHRCLPCFHRSLLHAIHHHPLISSSKSSILFLLTSLF